jgi:hypothetical protein
MRLAHAFRPGELIPWALSDSIRNYPMLQKDFGIGGTNTDSKSGAHAHN